MANKFHRECVAARREIARERIERRGAGVFKSRYVTLWHAEKGCDLRLFELAPFFRVKHGRLDGVYAAFKSLVESGDVAHRGEGDRILSGKGPCRCPRLISMDFLAKCLWRRMRVKERLGFFPKRGAVRHGPFGRFDKPGRHCSGLQLANDCVRLADFRQRRFLGLLDEAVQNVDDVADAIAVEHAVLVVGFLEPKFEKVVVHLLGLRRLHPSALSKLVDELQEFGDNGNRLREDEVVRLLGEDDLLAVHFGRVMLLHVETSFPVACGIYVITNDNQWSRWRDRQIRELEGRIRRLEAMRGRDAPAPFGSVRPLGLGRSWERKGRW